MTVAAIGGDKMFGRRKKDKEHYEQGYKEYETQAEEYLHDKGKAEGLLNQAIAKATTKKGALDDVWERLQLLFEAFRSWIKGDYKSIPTRSIITIIATILYFVNPLDLIPDFIVGLGLVDDAAVIAFAMKQINNDLDSFKEWKEKQQNTINA